MCVCLCVLGGGGAGHNAALQKSGQSSELYLLIEEFWFFVRVQSVFGCFSCRGKILSELMEGYSCQRSVPCGSIFNFI